MTWGLHRAELADWTGDRASLHGYQISVYLAEGMEMDRRVAASKVERHEIWQVFARKRLSRVEILLY